MRALQMHRSHLFFGYELIVDAFGLLQKGAHDVSARHAPRVSSRSAITRTHQTGQLLRVPHVAQ